jgi:hypothetical protein
MTSRVVRLLSALPLALALVACDDGGGAATGPAFSDSITTAAAEEFAMGVTYFAMDLAEGVNFGFPPNGSPMPGVQAALKRRGPLSSRSLGGRAHPAPDLTLLDPDDLVALVRSSPPEGCTRTYRGFNVDGTPVDVNLNGIADDLYVRVDCLEHDTLSYVDTVWTFSQEQEVRVKEDFGSLRGMTTTIVARSRIGDQYGTFDAQEVRMEAFLDIRTRGATERSSLFQRQSHDYGDGLWEGHTGEDWTASFTPASFILPGKPLPDGTLGFSGRRWATATDLPGPSFAIETTTPLAYSAECVAAATAPPFMGGEIRGRLNNDAGLARFTVLFPSCGKFSIATEGTVDPIP